MQKARKCLSAFEATFLVVFALIMDVGMAVVSGAAYVQASGDKVGPF